MREFSSVRGSQSRATESSDSFHRAALAHPKVDVQVNVNDELVWELPSIGSGPDHR